MSIIINDVAEAEAVKRVLQEITDSRVKHPRYPVDPLRRAALVCEEAGEALREAVDLTREFTINTTDLDAEAVRCCVKLHLDPIRERLFYETVQTAAKAIDLLVHMIREKEATT